MSVWNFGSRLFRSVSPRLSFYRGEALDGPASSFRMFAELGAMTTLPIATLASIMLLAKSDDPQQGQTPQLKQ